MLEEIRKQATAVAKELIEIAQLKSGQIVVIGCSSSEVGGHEIGSDSSPEVGRTLFESLHAVFSEKGIYLAAQCCEHLNRAIIIEEAAVKGQEIVNVVPQPKAGGSFATAAYAGFQSPIALEEIKADAGIDIGNTLIGMHLKKVAVPIRLKNNRIGEAQITAARTRPKYIGGTRAMYDDSLQ